MFEVSYVCVLLPVSLEASVDEAFEDAIRVGRAGGYVQVQVHVFLEGLEGESVVVDTNGEV